MRITRAPRQGITALDDWHDRVYDVLCGSLKSFFVPVCAPDTAHGTHYGKSLTAGTSCYFEFQLPEQIIELKQVTVKMIPTTTGSYDWTATVTHGGNAEDEASASDSATADGEACTDDAIESLNVTTAFDGLAQDDQIGVKFTVDTLTTTAALNVLGLLVKYI